MTVCSKCNSDVSKVYDCDHTDFQDYCVECYTELHYYLNEASDGDEGQGRRTQQQQQQQQQQQSPPPPNSHIP